MRRLSAASCFLLAGMISGPALAAPAPRLPSSVPTVTGLSVQAVEVEVLRLRMAMAEEVPHLVPRNAARDREWIRLARAGVAAASAVIDHPQLLVVVDRNPRIQELRIVMARPRGPWEVVGGTKVSTGEAGRFDHYITPVGIFPHDGAILDYRAEGTYNENHIRGLGVKGMRVWDFGWQWARRGWGGNEEPIRIRLEMHATDPDVLERRIGHPASAGCVRMPATLNRFMDHHGILDADYERMAAANARIRALLPPDRVPTPLAGDKLIVVDSAAPSHGPERRVADAAADPRGKSRLR